jgi:riboflavin kinase/FMN adenylyltransferase
MFALAKQEAKKAGGISVAYTFHPHPVKVLASASAPLMLNTLEQRLELIAECGIDAAVVEPFDLKFAHLKAEEWFEKILMKNLNAFGIVAGYDFTFGTHRSGTSETLERLCREHGLVCRILEARMVGDTLISSSRIRDFVRKGSMDLAGELLGRPYFIDGQVVAGAGRGAQLGIRTANLKTENELIPAGGVYATWTRIGKRKYRSVTNIGMNPTFGGTTQTIETHLLRFRGNLYGKKLRLQFVERLRAERSFSGPSELLQQIKKDIEKAEKILS